MFCHRWTLVVHLYSRLVTYRSESPFLVTLDIVIDGTHLPAPGDTDLTERELISERFHDNFNLKILTVTDQIVCINV